MKKVLLLPALSLLMIGTMNSCSKQKAETSSSSTIDKNSRSLMREPDITWEDIQNGGPNPQVRKRLWHGPRAEDENMGTLNCTDANATYCTVDNQLTTINTVELTALINPSPTMRMVFIDPSPVDPLIVDPGTYFPADIKLMFGMTNGLIASGAYTITYTAAYPNGFIDLPVTP